jgi:hypothetical protein
MQLTSAIDESLLVPMLLRDAAVLSSHYYAYGLNIRSDLPLPEFSRSPEGHTACPDAQVSFAPENEWIAAVRALNSSWAVDLNDARFWFRGVGAFQAIGGSQILITPEPGIDNHLLRMYVEGMIMATLLFQRGYFVLHSSVVKIGPTCVAFLGQVGAGKSSTAAALHARGHAVVTDDNAAIDLSGNLPQVTPAFPYLKVFPAIAASLGHAEESLTRMHSSQPKFAHDVAREFPRSPVPLDRIYVLSRNAEPALTRIPPSEAIIELVRNSVPTRWKLAGGAEHLRQCARLAALVPLFRIRTFDTLPELPALAERIENHRA